MEYYIVLKIPVYFSPLYRSPEALEGHDYQEWFYGESRRFRLLKVETSADLIPWLQMDKGVATFRAYNPSWPGLFEEHIHLCPECGEWFVHYPSSRQDWAGERDECILAEELRCEDCQKGGNV